MKIILIPSYYCFIFLYLTSFVMVMAGEDWFLVWLGLEINMMAFLVMIYRRCSLGVVESCMSYFFIQSLGSAMFISMFYLESSNVGGILSLILSYKIGGGPFFYWFPSMCSGIDWMSCYLLMLFQKILPLYLIMMFVHWMLWVVIFVSLVVGVLGSFNQSNIKQLMAYSSIHHLGWIIIISMSGGLNWMIYLFLYGVVLVSIIMFLINDEIVDLMMIYIKYKKFMFMLGMLSMAGMPPLLGFYLKWMALDSVIGISKALLMLLVMVSVVMLYVYIRIIYNVIMGSGLGVSWMEFKMFKYYSNWDINSFIGIILGMMLGVYLML